MDKQTIVFKELKKNRPVRTNMLFLKREQKIQARALFLYGQTDYRFKRIKEKTGARFSDLEKQTHLLMN